MCMATATNINMHIQITIMYLVKRNCILLSFKVGLPLGVENFSVPVLRSIIRRFWLRGLPVK